MLLVGKVAVDDGKGERWRHRHLVELQAGLQRAQDLQRHPLAGPVALFQGPGARHGAGRPAALIVLAGEKKVKQRSIPRRMSVAVEGQGMERTDQIPQGGHAEAQPALVLAGEVVGGVQQGADKRPTTCCGSLASHVLGQHCQAVEGGDGPPQAVPVLVAPAVQGIVR